MPVSGADSIAGSSGIKKAKGVSPAIFRVNHLRTLDTLSQ